SKQSLHGPVTCRDCLLEQMSSQRPDSPREKREGTTESRLTSAVVRTLNLLPPQKGLLWQAFDVPFTAEGPVWALTVTCPAWTFPAAAGWEVSVPASLRRPLTLAAKQPLPAGLAPNGCPRAFLGAVLILAAARMKRESDPLVPRCRQLAGDLAVGVRLVSTFVKWVHSSVIQQPGNLPFLSGLFTHQAAGASRRVLGPGPGLPLHALFCARGGGAGQQRVLIPSASLSSPVRRSPCSSADLFWLHARPSRPPSPRQAVSLQTFKLGHVGLIVCEPQAQYMEVFGAMHQNVTLSIVNHHVPIKDILWKKGKDKLIEWDELLSEPKSYPPFINRSYLNTNSGELTISNLTSSDEDEYEVESTSIKDHAKFTLKVIDFELHMSTSFGSWKFGACLAAVKACRGALDTPPHMRLSLWLSSPFPSGRSEPAPSPRARRCYSPARPSPVQPLPPLTLNCTLTDEEVVLSCELGAPYHTHEDLISFTWQCLAAQCKNTTARELHFNRNDARGEIKCVAENKLFRRNSSIDASTCFP
ncbi:Lymphocyte function-associated antigen 3, partial [Galemys pyrenaicus]